MEDTKSKLKQPITIDSAIKYAKVSIYTMLDTTNTVDPKKIGKEMLFNINRYNENVISSMVKGYEQGSGKK